MPTVTLNKNTVFKLIGKKIEEEKLKDRISMLGTDLESIEGNDINVEIFPNRPDMLSEQGFSRALGSFMGLKKGLREFKINKPEKDYKVVVEKSVKKIRPYTACAIVKNLKFDDEKIREIIQIQEKLHITYGRNRKKCAIGVYPLEKIKLPIRYVAVDPKKQKFQPLEMNKELDGLQILAKHPAGRDYAHLLEGIKKFPYFIDADDNVLSMPPIINSHLTGRITEDTKDVFVEFSGFDYDVLAKGLNMLVTALSDMGGDIYSMKIEYEDFDGKAKKINSPDLSPTKMPFDREYVNKWLGLELNETQMKDCLEKMGYGYEKGDKKKSEEFALVPAYRADVLHQLDLAEDVAIAYGYENFKAIIPNVATVGQENKFEIFKRRIAEILVGLDLLETKTYDLTNKKVQTEYMNLDPEKMNYVELSNALNIEYNILRFWTLPSIMKVLQDNKHHEYPQRIFTIGRIFYKHEDSETGTNEKDRMAVLLCENEADYTKARQILDAIMNALEMEYRIEETEHDSFVPGRVGRVIVKDLANNLGDKKIAYVGEIHPQVLENFELETPVAALELNLSDLYEMFMMK